MITYIIKTVLCSASLFLIYYLLLEREKMYRFNRFYLLFGLIFPFFVAFITIKVAAPIMPVQETTVLTSNSLPASYTTPIYTQTETFNYLPYLLLAFYFIVSGFLFYRFIRNLTRLISKIKGHKSIVQSGARLILTNDNAIPHSFLNYIFINSDKYEKGAIEKEVMQHELTHVKQMHSLDIILVELMIAFAWFNPLLYFFRRSILLNHEFLADQSVVETFNDTESYQLLLFEKANRKNNLILSSSFNYLITKKRLIMMTRKTSQKVAIIKQVAIIPLIAAIGFLFSTKVVAENTIVPLQQKQTESVKQDASQNIVDQYHAKLIEYGLMTKEGNLIFNTKKLSASKQNELALMYMKLSKSQQAQQKIVFFIKTGPMSKSIPTKEKLESWKNPNVYGVWIDGKKVDNAVLNNYTNTDFSQGDATYVAKSARVGKRYFMQVNLMTNAYYQKYRSEGLNQLKNDEYKYVIGIKSFSEADKATFKANKVSRFNEEFTIMKQTNKEVPQKDPQSKINDEKEKEQKAKLDDEQAMMKKKKAEMELQKQK
jgi:bla regulator protein BlaR1